MRGGARSKSTGGRRAFVFEGLGGTGAHSRPLHNLAHQVKPAVLWTHQEAQERTDSLASILWEKDADDAQQAFKKAKFRNTQAGKASLHEVQQIDRHCMIAFGTGLKKFVPSYFAAGVCNLAPGCYSSGQLVLSTPFEEAPLLRITSDREACMNNAQTFLMSRIRAVEVSDPCHVLWRCAQLGLEHAGYKGAVATLTVAMNAWKGHPARGETQLKLGGSSCRVVWAPRGPET